METIKQNNLFLFGGGFPKRYPGIFFDNAISKLEAFAASLEMNCSIADNKDFMVTFSSSEHESNLNLRIITLAN